MAFPSRNFRRGLKEIFSILLGFLPWIVFGVVAGPSLGRLNAAIIVALALVLVLGYKQLAHGFILTWGSLLFFGVNLVMVVLGRNLWVIKNLDILAKGTLAAIAWFSIFLGKPFVLQYARETVPPERQASPIFYRTCRTLAAIWGVVFLITTGMSVAKTYGWWAGGMGYQAVSLGLLGAGLGLNHWYPQYVRCRGKPGVSPNQPG
jgi:carotenoid cleavage dioxygenase